MNIGGSIKTGFELYPVLGPPVKVAKPAITIFGHITVSIKSSSLCHFGHMFKFSCSSFPVQVFLFKFSCSSSSFDFHLDLTLMIYRYFYVLLHFKLTTDDVTTFIKYCMVSRSYFMCSFMYVQSFHLFLHFIRLRNIYILDINCLC